MTQPKWLGLARPPLKKIQQISKIILKKNVIFSNIFLPILHNIGLYIYIIKYNSDIKIPGLLRNISKKIIKFQNIFKKKKYFIAYGQILNFFKAYLHKNKNCIFFMFKKNKKWIS